MANLMKAITAAMNIEAVKASTGLTLEQKEQQINEQLAAANEAGVAELCAMADELVNNRGETDGMLAAAGFNGRELRRESAIASVQAQIAALTEQAEQE